LVVLRSYDTPGLQAELIGKLLQALRSYDILGLESGTWMVQKLVLPLDTGVNLQDRVGLCLDVGNFGDEGGYLHAAGH
jgi:hypothetical protein